MRSGGLNMVFGGTSLIVMALAARGSAGSSPATTARAG
jgi:hypothetical protein